MIVRNTGNWLHEVFDGHHHAATRAVHPDSPGRTSTLGWTDLEPYRGTPIWMARAVAAKVLGEWPVWIEQMIACGQLEGKSDQHRSDWVLFDIDWTFDHLKARFLQTLEAPASYRDFDRYAAARRCFRIGSEEPHPEEVLDAAADFLLERGILHRGEVPALLPLPHGAPETVLDPLFERVGRRWGRLQHPPGAIDPEQFQLLVPKAIAHAPGTCFEAGGVQNRPSPPPDLLARLSRLKELKELGSLLVFRAAGRGALLGYLQASLVSLERLDDLLAELSIDLRDQAALSDFLDGLALNDTVAPDMAGPTRDRTVLTWLSMAREAEFLARLTSEGSELDLRPFVPASHRDGRLFARRFHKRFEEAREYSEARKKRSDALSDRFDFVLAAARRRCDQIADLGDVVALEQEDMLATGAERVRIEVPGWVLKEDGTYGDGAQEIHGHLWRGEALWRHLHDTGVLATEPTWIKAYRAALKKREPLGSGRFFFQYERTVPIGEATPVEPWFATLFRVGAPISPGNLDVDVLEARGELIREWRLPGFLPTKGGLLTWEEGGSFLYRVAQRAGIHLIPVEEFDHAMRAAHLAFRAGCMSGTRLNETLQMAYRHDRWPVVKVGPEKGRTGWLAVPAKPRKTIVGERDLTPRLYLVDDITYVYFDDLAQLVIRRSGHADGEIPDCPPEPGLAWKCGNLPYVFSLRGTPVHDYDLNRALRYLLAGIQVCTLHDARHSSANRGWVEGEEIEDTMLRLGHAVQRHSEMYRLPTEQQADRARARGLDRRIRAQDLRYWETIID